MPDKYISTFNINRESVSVRDSGRDQPNGVPVLDSVGKLPLRYLPASYVNNLKTSPDDPLQDNVIDWVTKQLYEATDIGLNITPRALLSLSLTGINLIRLVYGNGVWLCVISDTSGANLKYITYRSTDCVHWRNVSETSDPIDIVYVPDWKLFVRAVGDSSGVYLQKSVDADEWTTALDSLALNSGSDYVYKRLVAGNDFIVFLYKDKTTSGQFNLLYSKDLSNFNEIGIPTTQYNSDFDGAQVFKTKNYVGIACMLRIPSNIWLPGVVYISDESLLSWAQNPSSSSISFAEQVIRRRGTMGISTSSDFILAVRDHSASGRAYDLVALDLPSNAVVDLSSTIFSQTGVDDFTNGGVIVGTTNDSNSLVFQAGASSSGWGASVLGKVTRESASTFSISCIVSTTYAISTIGCFVKTKDKIWWYGDGNRYVSTNNGDTFESPEQIGIRMNSAVYANNFILFEGEIESNNNVILATSGNPVWVPQLT